MSTSFNNLLYFIPGKNVSILLKISFYDFAIILYFLYWYFVRSWDLTGVLDNKWILMTLMTVLSATVHHKYQDSTVLRTNLLARDMIFDVVRKYFSVGLQAVYLKCHFEVTVKPIESQRTRKH